MREMDKRFIDKDDFVKMMFHDKVAKYRHGYIKMYHPGSFDGFATDKTIFDTEYGLYSVDDNGYIYRYSVADDWFRIA